MGLGSILYNSNEYELAARCFMKAKIHRETFIGPDNPDTAATYNNIACCLFKLDRINEAHSYFDVA